MAYADVCTHQGGPRESPCIFMSPWVEPGLPQPIRKPGPSLPATLASAQKVTLVLVLTLRLTLTLGPPLALATPPPLAPPHP